jgi:multiple sugar transport system permease protein
MEHAMVPAPRLSRRTVENLLTGLGLVVYLLFALFPVFWMAITAFKRNSDLYNLDNIPLWFNEPPTFEHVRYLFAETLFPRWVGNTLQLAVCVVAITLVAAVPAGYALARLRFPGAETLGIGIFLTYLVPPTVLFLPLSRLISDLKLQDSLWALVLIYPTFTIPFCTWLLHGYFKTVPRELEEAACLDGCSRVGALLRVLVPVSLPGLLSVVIFAFTLSMQEFIYALTFVSSAAQKPVTLGVATDLIRGDIFFWGSLMAGALIAGVPVAILYSFFLEQFVAGLTGAVK